MKRGKKMFIIILSILVALVLITWGIIVYLGRKQTLSVKSIENPQGDLYFIHLTKPADMTWKAGSYAKFSLPDSKESEQGSRWLTIASNTDENEILILTHNSGSLYKKTLTAFPAGSKVEISWLSSQLSVTDGKEPIVCFASDVGIAAIRPIIKEWLGKRELVFNHWDKGVSVFDEEMAALANQVTNFTYEIASDLTRSRAGLKNAIEQYGNSATYLLAGQPDDVTEMKKFLEENGIDSKNIQTERFRGLK